MSSLSSSSCQVHPQNRMGSHNLLPWSSSSALTKECDRRSAQVSSGRTHPLQEIPSSDSWGTSFSFILLIFSSPLLHLPMFALPNPFSLFPLALFLNLVARHLWADPGCTHLCLSFPLTHLASLSSLALLWGSSKSSCQGSRDSIQRHSAFFSSL